MPAKWEYCEIVEEETQPFKDGFFKKMPSLWRWEACKITPSGPETILASREYEGPVYWSDKDGENRVAYQGLITQLLDKGWEPEKIKKSGRITLMKRRIGRANTEATTNSTDLLQQLANLRDAGILTEQEFQNKKAEILKRM